jgi:glycosyltransferase involved in cell wall biosynthesis
MLKSNTTIAVSKFIAEHIHSVYADFVAHKQPRIQVIHRGIDLDKFNPQNVLSERTDKLRQQWGIPSDHSVIMLPGRLTRWKGQSYLIEALADIKNDKLTCLMVGDNKGKDRYLEELKNLTQVHKQGARVKFVGGCKDMPAAYALADIVVSASTDPEAFGRVACEAQAMNCLVVATAHGGSLETISPAQQAFMCKVKDSDSLAKSINHALRYCQEDQQQARLDIEQQSRIYIAENFSLDKMCNDTIALYRETISKSTGQI